MQDTSAPGRGLRAAAVVALLACASLSAACGGAAEGFTTGLEPGSVPAASLEILTKAVPSGSVGAAYDPTRLAAGGASGPVRWVVVEGTLPPGMTVTDDGTLFGTPEGTGFYAFTVAATDGIGSDTQALGVAVEAFGAYVASGLHFGDAWAGRAVEIQFRGAGGEVQVTLAENGSGGTVVRVDAATGRVVYVPGQVPGARVLDMLRLTDAASGETVEVRLDVRPDPLAEHVARFGTTDVWKIDFEAKYGTHPYHSDWHAALVRLGLRDPAGTGALGSQADRLADLVARVAVLRHVNRHFLRNADGSAGAEGLAISFPAEDLSGYPAPPPGGVSEARPGAYNVIAVTEHTGLGVFGAAYIDAVGNPLVEHDAPSAAGGRLGVFVNRITDYVLAIFDDYGSALVDRPVGEADLPALRALLHDTAPEGARYALLAYTIEGLAKSVGVVCAHEIGHSLGLTHTNPSTLGSIMNYTPAIHETATYRFLPQDLAVLRSGLPGPGRVGAAAGKPGAGALPSGGLTVCGG